MNWRLSQPARRLIEWLRDGLLALLLLMLRMPAAAFAQETDIGRVYVPLAPQSQERRVFSYLTFTNGEKRLAACSAPAKASLVSVPLKDGELSLLQDTVAVVVEPSGNALLLPAILGDQTRTEQSTEMIEDETRRAEQQLKVLRSEIASVAKEEARLRTDAEVIGNFARIIDARSRSERLRSELALLKVENELLKSFAVGLPSDLNVRGGDRRNIQLTEAVVELTKAVGKSDQSASRELRRQRFADRDRARIEAVVAGKTIEELEAELARLKEVAAAALPSN